MSNALPIQEFVASLGFSVDDASWKKFEATLGHTGERVSTTSQKFLRSVGDAVIGLSKHFEHLQKTREKGAEASEIEAEVGKKTAGRYVDLAKGVEAFVKVASSLIKAQASITAGFAAIGGSIIAMADKVAMSDQQFRLFGERMYLAMPAAKKLSIALNELGASMADVAWDPELNERFLQLIDDQNVLQEKLGANFERNMRGIRNLRFEFQRLRVALTYLAQGFISRLFERLGVSVEALQAKVGDWVRWLSDNLPAVADKIAAFFEPILKNAGLMMRELIDGAKELGVVFTNFIGLLAGDSSIEGTEFSFQNLGKAIQDVTGLMAGFVHWIVVAEKMLLHLVNAALLGASGHFRQAGHELQEAFKDITKQSLGLAGIPTGAGLGAAFGGVAAGAVGEAIAGPGGAVALAPIGAALGAPVGTVAGGISGYIAGWLKEHFFPHSYGKDVQFAREGERINAGKPGNVPELVAAAARRYGIDPALALAVAKKESDFQQYRPNGSLLTSGRGAIGIMQLMPEKAKELGVDPNDPNQNIEGGVKLLSQLVQKYHGNISDVLTAYNAGPGRVGAANLPHETVGYIASAEALMRQFQKSYPGDTYNQYSQDVYHQAGDVYQGDQSSRAGDVSIGTVQVNVTQSDASPEDIQRAAVKGVLDAINYQTQRNLTNFAPAY